MKHTDINPKWPKSSLHLTNVKSLSKNLKRIEKNTKVIGDIIGISETGLHFTKSQRAKTRYLEWDTSLLDRSHKIIPCNWKVWTCLIKIKKTWKKLLTEKRKTLPILGNVTFFLLYCNVAIYHTRIGTPICHPNSHDFASANRKFYRTFRNSWNLKKLPNDRNNPCNNENWYFHSTI